MTRILVEFISGDSSIEVSKIGNDARAFRPNFTYLIHHNAKSVTERLN
jgi:hypothetical protein